MRSRSARGESPRDSPRDDEGAATVTPSPSSRRFALGDAVVVIAMLAGLCVWFRRDVTFGRLVYYVRHAPSIVRCLYFDGPTPPDLPWLLYAPADYRDYLWRMPLTIVLGFLLPLLIVATPGTLAMRLRKPRPAWGTVFRQPGTVACLALLVTLLVLIDLEWFGVPIPQFVYNPGAVVAVCWAALLLSRQWRSEAGWVDRLGRIVGFGWVVETLIEVVEKSR